MDTITVLLQLWHCQMSPNMCKRFYRIHAMFTEFLIKEVYFIHIKKIIVISPILSCILLFLTMILQADSFGTILHPVLSQS